MALRRTALSEDGKTLKITVNWFGWSSLGMAVLSTIWISIVFGAIDNPFRVIAELLPSLVLFLFSITGGGVAVVLCYLTAAGFLNRTEIVVDEQWIIVRHLPLPWRGKKVEVASLKQILVEEVHDPDDGYYSIVRALTHAGGKLILATFSRRKDADFAADQINKFLNVRVHWGYYVKRKANNI